jgi:uncharacterized protein (DUF736 family)
MANIGYVRPNANGALIGRIECLAFNNVIGLSPVESNNPRAPKFEVMARSGNNWVRVGALFEQTARTTGEVFYQGRIDDPKMDKPLDVALFGNSGPEGGYNVSWTRRRVRQDFGQTASANGDDGEGEGDGLGNTTAKEEVEADPFAGFPN